jgi:hypothetical protein
VPKPQKGSAPKCTRMSLTNLSSLIKIAYGKQGKGACIEGGRDRESGEKALGNICPVNQGGWAGAYGGGSGDVNTLRFTDF